MCCCSVHLLWIVVVVCIFVNFFMLIYPFPLQESLTQSFAGPHSVHSPEDTCNGTIDAHIVNHHLLARRTIQSTICNPGIVQVRTVQEWSSQSVNVCIVVVEVIDQIHYFSSAIASSSAHKKVQLVNTCDGYWLGP